MKQSNISPRKMPKLSRFPSEFSPERINTLSSSVHRDEGFSWSNPTIQPPVVIQLAWALVLRSFLKTDNVSYAVYEDQIEIIASNGRPNSLGSIPRLIDLHLNGTKTLGDLFESVRTQRELQPEEFVGTTPSILKVYHGATDQIKSTIYETAVHPTSMQAGWINTAVVVSCVWNKDGASLICTYDDHVLEEVEAHRILAQFTYFTRILAELDMETTLDQLRASRSPALAQIFQWNAKCPDRVDRLAHDLIVAQASQRPHAIAVDAWDAQITYHELDIFSSALAQRLLLLGAQPNSLIPFCFEKSAWSIVAILSILKAGAAFIPLDPMHPPNHLQRIVDRLQPTILLTSPGSLEKVASLAPNIVLVSQPEIEDLLSVASTSVDLFSTVTSNNLAYIIFTSGSTGTPKGVLIEHQSLVASCLSLGKFMGSQPQSKMLQFSSFTFDASILEIFPTLFFGGCVCIPSDSQRTDHLEEYIDSHKIDMVFLTPSVARLLDPRSIPSVRTLTTGGEAFSGDTLKSWLENRTVFNAYGPSEVTIACNMTQLTPSLSSKCIGHAISTVSWIVDPNDHNILLPVGSVGELVVQGHTVARGYYKDEKKTAMVFIEAPTWYESISADASKRFYKTGDLVKYDSDGSVIYVGRKDTQIKLRGQRVELGEIEYHLCSNDTVSQALVFFPSSGRLRGQIVGIVVLADNSKPNFDGEIKLLDESARAEQIIEQLSELLPKYMVPARLLVVESLPLLPSGKINKRLLDKWLEETGDQILAPDATPEDTLVTSRSISPAMSSLQHIISQVLNIPISLVDFDKSFLGLGGDSISAMQIVSYCKTQGMTLKTKDVLNSGSIIEMVDHVIFPKETVKPIIQEENEEIFALSPVQSMYLSLAPDGDNGFNQGFLLKVSDKVDNSDLYMGIRAVVQRHSMLRARFIRDSGKWVQHHVKNVEASFSFREYRVPDWNLTENSLPDGANLINMETGPLLVADVIRTDNSGLFLRLVAHHLVIDLVSWRIILNDLETFFSLGKLPPEVPLGFQTWIQLQDEFISAEPLPATLRHYEAIPIELEYWGIMDQTLSATKKKTTYVSLDTVTTKELMTGCHSALGTNPVDIMLSALQFSFHSIFDDRSPPTIFNEGHGRNLGDSYIDLSQTVGWFTVLYPILVAQTQHDTIIDVIKRVKDFRRTLAGHEVSFFTSQVIGKRDSDHIAKMFPLEILFNFFGQYQQLEKGDALLQQVPYGITEDMGTKCAPLALFDISAQIERSQLRFAFTYDEQISHQDKIHQWISEFPKSLDKVLNALPKLDFSYTLTDFPLLSLDYESLGVLIKDRLLKVGLTIPNDIEDIFPCTGMQEGILASQSQNSSLYRSRIRWQIIADSGQQTDVEALKRAWKQVVRRHSALRTIFIASVGSDTLFDQVVLKDKFPDAHVFICTETEAFSPVPKQITDQRHPLYEHEFTIYDTGRENIFCELAINHALFDGTSVQVVSKDLALAYKNELSQKTALSYKEYVLFLSRASQTEHQIYWDNYLADCGVCQLPTFEGEQTDHAETSVGLDSMLIHQLREFCIQKNVTVANVFQLAWALILRHLTNSDSICFGCLTSGRDVPVDGIQDAVGAYMNMLVCRFDINEMSPLIDILQKSTQDFRQSLEHQNISLADIHRGLGLQGEHLFNTAISFQRPSSENVTLGHGVRMEELTDQDPSEYDMTLNVRDSPHMVEILLRYWKPRVSDQQAQDIGNMLGRAIALIVEDSKDSEKIVSTLDLSDIQDNLFFEWNRNLPLATDRCLHHIFQSVSQTIPNQEAVYAWDGTLSYSELDRISSTLAEKLVALGVGPEVLVPVCFEKSLWAIVAQLGVLKAGGGFVPIDPSHPPQRHLTIMEDVKAKLVLASAATSVKLAEYIPHVFEVSKQTVGFGAQVPANFCSSDVKPANVAYIIFTSGSTGNPKGVVIEHRAVSSSCTEHAGPMGLKASSRVLQFSSYTFDAAVAEIFTTLIMGGTVCVPSEKHRMGDIVTFINKADVNWVFSTPSFIRTVDPATVPKLQTLAVGGEIVGQDILTTWTPHVTFIHVYGPTECCIFSLSHTVKKDEAHRVILGRSFGSVSWIVHPNNLDKLSALGAVGELLIQGPILGRGYLNEPEKTKAAFIDSPKWLPGTPQKMYRTGDLVRYNLDGSLMYIGRKDNQVKLRGQRLELGEIEYNMSLNLSQHTAAVVELVERAGMDDSKALAAFICDDAASTQPIPDNDLFDPMTSEFRVRMVDMRRELYKCLPSYMVPSIYIHLKKLPATPTGKLNRQLLRSLVRKLSQSNQALYSLMTDEPKTQPSSDLGKKMQKLWAGILKMEASKIGVEDNFFHLGGDSIAALKLVSLARGEKLSIEVADIFRNPSLKLMSLVVKTNDIAAPVPLKPFALLMGSFIEQSATICHVEKNQIIDAYPCTPLQEGLLALSDKQPGAYVSNFIFRLPVEVDIDQFKLAWSLAVETTPILRTRIVAIDNWPTLQVVTSEALQWRTGTSLQDYLVEAEGLAFKIGLPLSHYALIHEREERYFVFTAHHSIYDGWSLPLLFRKVENIYHQREPSLALSDGFSNFIQHITSVDEAQSRKFWGGLLAGAKQLNFPQYPNPEYTSIADESVTHSIKFGSPSSDFTTATILQGAWAILLGMHGESTDVTFGSVISGRNTTIPGISEVIGPTISTVPVRVLLERSQSIRDFLQHLQNQTLERIPFEQAGIQNITKLGPDALAACQFQSLLVIQPLDVQMATILGSERIESNDINARSIPLTMECNLGETRLEIIAHFDSNLIEKSKMDVIIHQFEHIFLELSSKQGKLIREIPLCGHYDKQLIRHWNKEIPAASKTCVHHLFKRQVVLQPDSPAVHAWDFKLNYSELDRYARKFAHYLVSLGVGPEVWVPVVMDKSAWTIVAMVAILKAGGACAALDPSHPSRRLSGIIQDLEARVLVVSPQYKNRFVDLSDYTVPVDKAFLDSLPAQTEDPETTVDHTNAAVAIFTSGSTGKPKGIVIEHAHLCTSSKAHGSAQGVGPGTRVFSFASYAFDVSLGDTWTTIMRGACICIPSEADRLNNLAQTITNMRANWLALTPTVSRLLTPNMIPTVKTLTLGGEAIGKDDVTTWADHLRVVGFYGPAETVIGAMMSDLSADRTLNPRTLGHGLNTNLWVVDPDDQDRLVPVGTIGELLIQGPAISRGYLNDLDRTAKSYLTTKPKFLTDAAFGVGHDQKIFKTGDLVYQTPRDGALVYVGRKDTQIKLHGQRIELQEIEEQLVLHSIGHLKSVAWAVELIQPAGPETCFLAAFFANNGTTGQQTNIQDIDIRPIPSELRELLLSVKKLIASHVPKYMVPAMFTPLTKMPMNTSGKTDRGQLRLLGKGLAVKTNSASYSLNEKSFKPKPRRISGNSKELRIKKLWSKCLCLPLDSISSTDDFFDLGGNSVTAMRLAASARAEGFALSVQDIFRNSSLADMSITAASVVKAGENSNVLEAVRRQVARFSHEAEDAARITDYQEWVISHGLTKHSGFYNDLFFEFDGAVDAGRLRDACVSLVHHNPIMRSAFVAHKGRLILVDRKESSLDIDFQQYTWSHETATAAPMLWEQQPLRLGKPPVKFALIKKSPTSHRLVLRISHAQYDGLTLPLLLEDLSAAYLGEALASRPSFFNFLRNNEEKDNTPHLHYWRELLENASLTQIVQHKSLLHRGTMDAYVQQAVRNPSLRSTGTTVTNATIFKAAWGLALSKLSGNEDVVFGHIIAGRNDSDHDYTSTFGACLNVTPVRVRTTPNQISSQLLSSIHTQAVASIPHEGVGFKSIFQACTSWQTWENFSSILQHQNLDSSKKPTSFGDSFCSFSGGVARVGAAVDVWIMTMPRGDETDVQLHYSSLIPRHVAQEMLELFCAATDALCDEGVRDVSIDRLISKKIDVKFPLVPQEESEQEMAKVTPVPQQESIESRRLHQIVDDVWRQVGCHDGSDMIPLDKSFLDLGGDLVAACLMANIYHGKKYQITVEDICNHLTVRSQRNFLMKQLVE